MAQCWTICFDVVHQYPETNHYYHWWLCYLYRIVCLIIFLLYYVFCLLSDIARDFTPITLSKATRDQTQNLVIVIVVACSHLPAIFVHDALLGLSYIVPNYLPVPNIISHPVVTCDHTNYFSYWHCLQWLFDIIKYTFLLAWW